MSAAQNIPTGKVGKVFGGVVNAFTQEQTDADVPPAKRPFPWE